MRTGGREEEGWRSQVRRQHAAVDLDRWQLTYQRRLAQELVPLHQVAESHVEVGAAAGPAGDAVERVVGQLLLHATKKHTLNTRRRWMRCPGLCVQVCVCSTCSLLANSGGEGVK